MKNGLEDKEIRAMPDVFRKVDDSNPSFTQKNKSVRLEIPEAVGKEIPEDYGPEVMKNRSDINSKRIHSLSKDVLYVRESKENLQKDVGRGVCEVQEANNFSAKAVRGLYMMIFDSIRKNIPLSSYHLSQYIS